MANLFTNYAIIKSIMRDARRTRTNTEEAAIKIQGEIDQAAEQGKGYAMVHTGDFRLASAEREAINLNLTGAGYKYTWLFCNTIDEIVQVRWEDTDD